MAYHLRRKDASVQAGVQRIALSQVNAAIEEIDDPALGPHETVHQVRKRCKKLRGLIRLVRSVFPAYEGENAAFRDAARTLSFVRDAEAKAETYDLVAAAFAGRIDRANYGSIRWRLTVRKNALANDQSLNGRLAAFREEMMAARSRIGHWVVEADGFDAIGGGLAKSYKRARKALSAVEREPTAENVHEWRKRAKYHWYHLRLLRGIWPEVLVPQRDAADALGDLLGDHHDLAVLQETLAREPEAFGGAERTRAFSELARERQAELLADAIPLGHRLFAEKPKALRKRLETYWGEWKAPSGAAALAA